MLIAICAAKSSKTKTHKDEKGKTTKAIDTKKHKDESKQHKGKDQHKDSSKKHKDAKKKHEKHSKKKDEKPKTSEDKGANKTATVEKKENSTKGKFKNQNF